MFVNCRLFIGAVYSYAKDEDKSRYALACSSNSFAFLSASATLSAPAIQRFGGSFSLAIFSNAAANLAGSPPCFPLILCHPGLQYRNTGSIVFYMKFLTRLLKKVPINLF